MLKMDFVQLGDVPLFLRTKDGARAFDDGDQVTKVQAIADNAEYFLRLRNHIVANCIVTPGFKVVVDRPQADISDDEMHIDEMAEDDVSAIISAAMSASGVSSGAVATATPFPEKPAVAGNP